MRRFDGLCSFVIQIQSVVDGVSGALDEKIYAKLLPFVVNVYSCFFQWQRLLMYFVVDLTSLIILQVDC
jgi:hypothetical protein